MNPQPTKPDDTQRSPEDKALAARWGKRLSRALEAQTKSGQEKKFRKLRQYVSGEVGDDGQGGLVRTNIIHSNFAAILPQVYAKNPEIAVTPSEAAGDSQYPWIGAFSKTLQSVLNRKFIRDAKLKKRAKACIRAAMTTAVGWAKISWQEDVRRDPQVENRIADTQDNLQRVRHLIESIEDGSGNYADLDAQRGELEQQLAALEKQVEVRVVQGLVIDYLLTEDVFILDDTLYDFDGYEQADAIAHRVWMTCERYKETFGKDAPKTATKYGADKKDASKGASTDKDAPQLVAVFEVWDRISNTIYTLCAGADEWARDPYQPDVSGQRWYPFFPLAFNPIDGRATPVADAELLIELQDEYNTTRTNFAEHRKENLPGRFYRENGELTNQHLKTISNRSANEWIGIPGNPDRPVSHDIAIIENPAIDPQVYDVSPILRDAEMLMGAGDASKGFINKAKTATEAEIMAQGLQSRVGDRQDVVEDWIAEMARYAAEILLQKLSRNDVLRIAGAEAVWPQLTKDDVFDLVQIEIRAGSTGKPNRARERDQWAQLLPEIQKAVSTVAEMRAKGQNDMADTVLRLLEETLRRFDERIDIESFIKATDVEDDAPTIPPEVQQQIANGQEMLAQLQEENAKLQAALEDRQAEQQAASERARLDADAAIEQARIKAEAQAASAVEIARIRAESEERMAAISGQHAQMMAQVMDQLRQMMACMMPKPDGQMDAAPMSVEEQHQNGV